MNTVVIMGRLTRTPELKTSNSGIKFVNFSIAVDRGVGTEKKQCDFFDCVAFPVVSKEFVNSHIVELSTRI